MKTKDTKQQKPRPEEEAVIRFREYILEHYTNVPIDGSDKEFHTSMELLWMMRDTIPLLDMGSVTKVMRELDFSLQNLDGFAVWEMHRIDGVRLLEKDFGVSRDGD